MSDGGKLVPGTRRWFVFRGAAGMWPGLAARTGQFVTVTRCLVRRSGGRAMYEVEFTDGERQPVFAAELEERV